MKRNILLLAVICNFLFASLFAQQYENFYTTKARLGPYYDNFIQENGIDNMQGTGYKQYKRWVDYWDKNKYLIDIEFKPDDYNTVYISSVGIKTSYNPNHLMSAELWKTHNAKDANLICP